MRLILGASRLNQVSVHEASRLGLLPIVDEGAPLAVREAAHPFDHLRQPRLHLWGRWVGVGVRLVLWLRVYSQCRLTLLRTPTPLTTCVSRDCTSRAIGGWSMQSCVFPMKTNTAARLLNGGERSFGSEAMLPILDHI